MRIVLGDRPQPSPARSPLYRPAPGRQTYRSKTKWRLNLPEGVRCLLVLVGVGTNGAPFLRRGECVWSVAEDDACDEWFVGAADVGEVNSAAVCKSTKSVAGEEEEGGEEGGRLDWTGLGCPSEEGQQPQSRYDRNRIVL